MEEMMSYQPRKPGSFTAMKVALLLVCVFVGAAVARNYQSLTAGWTSTLCIIVSTTICIYVYVHHLEGKLERNDIIMAVAAVLVLMYFAATFGIQALTQ